VSTATVLAPPAGVEDPDQWVILNGIDWWQFETFLAIRGDRAGVRVTYLEGQLEIRSPSRRHEMLKTMIARLLEAYADEKGLVFEGYGSLTMRNPAELRGSSPTSATRSVPRRTIPTWPWKWSGRTAESTSRMSIAASK
jgi:Uma2 family endonuclease